MRPTFLRKSVLAYSALCLLTSAFLLSGCMDSAGKVASAEEKVTEANKDLENANAAYLADVEKYRRETAARIAENNATIAAFNARVENEKREVDAEHKKKIAALEQKNTDLKKRLADYKAEGKDKWEIFKSEFSRDMQELGAAFKDLTVNNVK
jgi:septal ring factor EnvC (AmiA/AmiB activator)